MPGAVWGWDEVQRRFGTLTFKETLQPAIDYAEQGFPVSERIAHDWRLAEGRSGRRRRSRGVLHAAAIPMPIATWYVNGQPPGARDRSSATPASRKTFRILQQQGRDGFYKARSLAPSSTSRRALGGTMTLDDLASYAGEWTTAATTNYHGYDVFTLPPPAQTWATDEILNILEACVPQWAPGQTLAEPRSRQPECWHFVVEAKKLAFTRPLRLQRRSELRAGAARSAAVEAHAASLCSKVDPDRASAHGRRAPAPTRSGDTIVLVDGRPRRQHGRLGEQPVHRLWFRRDVVPGYGITLHNRGGLFTLDPKSPNVIAPHKRPFNTLSAGFVMQNDRPLMTVTLMGGDMQAQGIAQVLLNMLDLGANVQAASDMARFRHTQVPNVLTLESQLFGLRGRNLQGDGTHGEVDQRRHRRRLPGHQCSRPTTTTARSGRVRATQGLLPGRVRPSQGWSGGRI